MEQFGPRCRLTSARLAFANHMDRLVAGDRTPGSPERAKMLACAYPALDRPMILFQNVIRGRILHRSALLRNFSSLRYCLCPQGYSICLVFLKLFERIYSPLAAGLLQPYSPDSKLHHTKRTQLDRLCQKIVDDLRRFPPPYTACSVALELAFLLDF